MAAMVFLLTLGKLAVHTLILGAGRTRRQQVLLSRAEKIDIDHLWIKSAHSQRGHEGTDRLAGKPLPAGLRPLLAGLAS
jgi:hypothetical protein